ncbi:Uncharacterised protein [Escherichia coli]|uniref:Trm112 family protein n=1 Tax=Escherichia coli TaxID=562 RepID=A0A376LA90_ECOLX|nr:Uncharacterised protein [Escherichia coli]
MDHRLLEIIACPVCNENFGITRKNKNLFANWTTWLSRCAMAFQCCWKRKPAC